VQPRAPDNHAFEKSRQQCSRELQAAMQSRTPDSHGVENSRQSRNAVENFRQVPTRFLGPDKNQIKHQLVREPGPRQKSDKELIGQGAWVTTKIR
jgi:hypothetical protein